ncbi:MAG: hypothetical protein ACKVOG_07675, partial [Rhodoglobus sp.]
AVPAKATGWVVGAVANLSAADAFSALNQIVDAVRDSIQVHQTESTKREKVIAYRDMEVARIRSSEKVLREYFDRIFEERRETHKRLFDGLDAALESGDVAAMQTIVGGIVEVARTSPLANIGNINELKRAMDDPTAVFEF